MAIKLSRRTWIISAAIALVVVTIGALVFKPWLLFVNVEVNDAIPQVAPTTAASPGATESSASTAESSAQQPEGPVLISSGEFVSHEHSTSGKASIYRLPDGTHQLALENLETTTGPDVRVWLSAGPVVEGRDGWFTAGQHPHLELAPLKGNRGNQVYALPADVDPSAWPTVDLWCVAFGVSFGAAALTPLV
ncbi:DM13 domain-containing protein [Arachnia propionica]|uniref:DM13 domain-containing protein n=1 Tax=Arachnia propionica TaxID=1750 RepID=UPI001C8BF4D0|nr:DM13 domain-containing protein [Arachnia propionica]